MIHLEIKSQSSVVERIICLYCCFYNCIKFNKILQIRENIHALFFKVRAIYSNKSIFTSSSFVPSRHDSVLVS